MILKGFDGSMFRSQEKMQKDTIKTKLSSESFYKQHIEPYLNEPSSISSLSDRAPKKDSFTMANNFGDFGLKEMLLNNQSFSIQSPLSELSLRDRLSTGNLSGNTTQKDKLYAHSVDDHFSKIAPKDYDYRYVDPQYYQYKLQNQSLNKMAYNNARAENITDITQLDPTNRAVRNQLGESTEDAEMENLRQLRANASTFADSILNEIESTPSSIHNSKNNSRRNSGNMDISIEKSPVKATSPIPDSKIEISKAKRKQETPRHLEAGAGGGRNEEVVWRPKNDKGRVSKIVTSNLAKEIYAQKNKSEPTITPRAGETEKRNLTARKEINVSPPIPPSDEQTNKKVRPNTSPRSDPTESKKSFNKALQFFENKTNEKPTNNRTPNPSPRSDPTESQKAFNKALQDAEKKQTTPKSSEPRKEGAIVRDKKYIEELDTPKPTKTEAEHLLGTIDTFQQIYKEKLESPIRIGQDVARELRQNCNIKVVASTHGDVANKLLENMKESTNTYVNGITSGKRRKHRAKNLKPYQDKENNQNIRTSKSQPSIQDEFDFKEADPRNPSMTSNAKKVEKI